MKARRLTVASASDAWRVLTGAESPKSKVTLSGAWLRAAGFFPGDRCRIETGRGLLLVVRETSNRESMP